MFPGAYPVAWTTVAGIVRAPVAVVFGGGGLIQALTTGLPGYPPTWMFFKNTLLSGGLFTGLFCGAMKLSESAQEKEAPAEESGDEPFPEEA